MHIILGILSLVGVVLFWYWRARMAREAAGDLADAANDVRLAARRFLYRRKHNTHPADSVDDARLAAAGIAVAIATMDQPISQTEIKALATQARVTFGVAQDEADDIAAFGRWIAGQCGTEAEAVRRLSKRVATLAGAEALSDLLSMVQAVATADGNALDEQQEDALRVLRQTIGH